MEAAASSAEYGYYGGGAAGPRERKTTAAAGCGDHFVVDDLLALPYDDDDEEEGGGEAAPAGDGGEAPPPCLQPAVDARHGVVGLVKEERGGGGLGNFSADSSTVTALDSCSNSFSGLADGDFPGEFCEPVTCVFRILSIRLNFFGKFSLLLLAIVSSFNSSTAQRKTVRRNGDALVVDICYNFVGVQYQDFSFNRPEERKKKENIWIPVN
jgi:hypothetical protein